MAFDAEQGLYGDICLDQRSLYRRVRRYLYRISSPANKLAVEA